jgi:hypothetical protein
MSFRDVFLEAAMRVRPDPISALFDTKILLWYILCYYLRCLEQSTNTGWPRLQTFDLLVINRLTENPLC